MSDETAFTRKGDYEILGVLGAGGMGSLQVRNCFPTGEAMKVLLPICRSEGAGRPFLREIKVLASLTTQHRVLRDGR